MGTRRKARELAVQMLYQWELSGESADRVMASFAGLQTSTQEANRFARELVAGTVIHVGEIDALISQHAENWRMTRMPIVDRNILRLAAYELLFQDQPGKVVINEALEVAKKFSNPEAVQFINGVLDAVRHAIEAQGAR